MTAIRRGSAQPALGQHARAVGDVADRVEAPVPVVGVHERAPEAGRAADVRREHGDAGGGQHLVLRVEGRALLRLRTAVQADHGRRPDRRCARYSQPVSGSPSCASNATSSGRDEVGARRRWLGVTGVHAAVATSRRHSRRGATGPSTDSTTQLPSRAIADAGHDRAGQTRARAIARRSRCRAVRPRCGRRRSTPARAARRRRRRRRTRARRRRGRRACPPRRAGRRRGCRSPAARAAAGRRR